MKAMAAAASFSMKRFRNFRAAACRRIAAHNKQLQRTVTRRRGDGASAPFHYALAPRFTRHRAAAELRRYAAYGAPSVPGRKMAAFEPIRGRSLPTMVTSHFFRPLAVEDA
jgi:hypothetical protein